MRILLSKSVPWFIVAAVSFGVFPQDAVAVSKPIQARAINVIGTPNYYSVVKAKTLPVVKGTRFVAGDKIITGSSGVVEILMDTGDLMNIDNNSEITIKSLHKDTSGKTISTFWLAFGRVKAAVLRKLTTDSKFEFHTKSAIAGVSGSPPFHA